MIVVDTNIIAYFYLPGEFSELAQQIYRKDQEWFSPPIWRIEFLNVLAGYIRRKNITLRDAYQFIEAANVLIQTNNVDDLDILELINNSTCTAYDCEFVSLAKSLWAPLITADKKILKEFAEIAVSPADYLEIV